MSEGYVVTHSKGVRWYDFPYKVTLADLPVGMASTRWGARLLIRKDRRERVMGTEVVHREPS